MLKLACITLVLSVFISCSEQPSELRISINPWIGYTPFYYAQEKDWLDEVHIKLIHSTSLSETIEYYNSHLIDGFVSTQYEAQVIGPEKLIHLMALNRSNGGDVILSHHPMEAILNSDKITVYLEIDSVNKLVLEDFMNQFNITAEKFFLINKEQVLMKDIPVSDEEMFIIVTYEPYATTLRNNGYKEVISSANSSLLILDSLYVEKTHFETHQEQLTQLNKVLIDSYAALKRDPEEYYNTVKHYLAEVTYEEFTQALTGIEWLVDADKDKIKRMIGNRNILDIQ